MNQATTSDTEQSPMLTPSDVLEHIYCPRFTWFMHVQNIPQYEDRRFKVLKGREVHQRRETENKAYLRRKLGVVKKETAVYLASAKLRLRGIIDELLWLADGSIAPLDYKFTPPRDNAFKTHRIQITLYAMLAAAEYQQSVHKGFVAYIRGPTNLIEIPITEDALEDAARQIDQIFAIISSSRLPRHTPYRARCQDCCYKNICV
jgi:CRISPR-associated exonuclease Cas4